MIKLIRVDRTVNREIHIPDGNWIQFRQIHFINPARVHEEDVPVDTAEFFAVDEADEKHFVAYLARRHPGREIQVYNLTSVNICPAADMITKQVSKEGILPE
jgi:hypothetical protein